MCHRPWPSRCGELRRLCRLENAVAGLTKAAALETAQMPRLDVRTLLVEHEIEEVAKARSVSAEEAVRHILGQVQPAGQFVTDRSNWGFGKFPLRGQAASITGATFCIDGGWTAA